MNRIVFIAIGILVSLLAPLFLDKYVLSILILSLYFAFVGQAWNLMMGFAGQLSLGHALYVGLGAYLGAGFFVQFGLNPWLTIIFAFCASAVLGAFIAWLGFRFAIKGVHFALLTIAFAESARLIFDHLDFFGGTGGLFLPVKGGEDWNFLQLRGQPLMFYYVFLGATAALCLFIRSLLKTRFGYYMMALREDQEAAQSLGIDLLRVKIIAVALSGGIASIGGLLFAFYQNSLFPDHTFAMARSIEFLMGPIVGGVGTLVGPIVGALLLTPLGEAMTALLDLVGLDLPGTKHLFYGLSMLLIMLYLPKGIWPFFEGYITRLFSEKKKNNSHGDASRGDKGKKELAARVV